jgi:tRNA nucleotidyltransferase/poly(A) polymerase
MSDYMFMLENHLTAAQNRVVAEVQRAAAEANVNVFLTGGTVRDMFGGFPIRDLDFTFEGPPQKLAKVIADNLGATIVATDSHRKSTELISPEGVTFELSMARTERYTKPGAKPQVAPAALHDDLLRRDFTINALGLSLNRASRGLLLDPTNGMGDLVARELRAANNYIFYDSPVRLLRLIRFRVRLGFTVAERTMNQYRNAREGEVEKFITREELLAELRHAADEPNIGDLLQAWDEDGLLRLVTPGLTASALNIGTFQKLQKFRESLPFGLNLHEDRAALFFALLTENLPPKEKAAVVDLDGAHASSWQKLAARSAKLEKEIAAPAMQKASKIYALLSHAPGEQITYLALRSTQRVVQDRIRNYFAKHVPAAQEITDLQVIEAGYTAGTPKFEKAKAEMIAKRLDARPKKVEPEEQAEIA